MSVTAGLQSRLQLPPSPAPAGPGQANYSASFIIFCLELFWKTKLSFLSEMTGAEVEMLSRLWRSLKPRYNSHSQHMVHVSDKIVIYEKFCALPILAGICGLFVYFWLHSPRQSSVNKPCPQRAEHKQNQPITVTQIGQVCHQSSLCWNKSSVSIQTRLQYK